jgi:ribosomal protein S18 acetylase RimI-like enzyme
MDEQTLSHISVRHPTEEDIRAIASFSVDSKKNTAEFEKRHQVLYRDINMSKSPRKFFLVIQFKDDVAGFVRAVRSRNPLSGVWWIEGLEIKPSLQRKGLGSFLLKEALYNIYHRGCKKVFLKVDRNNEAAHAFYISLKFKKAHGSSALLNKMLSGNKEVLTLDLSDNESWINRPQKGYKYMGIH